ncbi:cytochrome c oxidase subunit II [Devosia oryzisoli]|uniref:cytochrome c oxidase subunit II n=1 Tax=Devosia oryzisoli TaxID=2774138 RepID=UPI0020C02E91|nr:cytochrome c oxidase subunit II [Devosia oryzisoli]
MATPVLLAGCTGELSALDPAGPRAANLALLWWVMLAGAAVLTALVLALLTMAYLRPHRLAGVTAGQWIVGGGLILPIPILMLLTGTALVLGEQLLPRGEVAYRAEARAEQWAWRFSYPDVPGLPVSETLHIPAGEPVDIAVTSADVIHAFWVPRLGGKIDAIPGHRNVIRLQADEPGIYRGICAEFCGPGHETMQFRVEAHDLETFKSMMAGAAP